MERYQVITRGVLAKGHTKDAVMANLSRSLSLTDYVVSDILSGQPKRLKSQLTWHQAQKTQQQLYQLGLKTELLLQLNADCLKQGLVRISQQAPQEEIGQSMEDRTWFLDEQKASPTIYASAGESVVKNQSGKQALVIQLKNGYWSAVPLFLLAVFAGIANQNYFLRWTTTQLNWSMAATLLSLCLLMGSILLIPKLLQRPQVLSLRTEAKNGAESLSLGLQENYTYFIGKKRFSLIDADEHQFADIVVKKNQAQLFIDGECWYSWNHEKGVNDEAVEAVDQLKDNLIENTFIGNIFKGISVIKEIRSMFSKKVVAEALVFKPVDGLPIRDASGKLVAALFQTPELALRIYSEEVPEKELLNLVALGWVMSGSSWV